jgi:hypothetical protein
MSEELHFQTRQMNEKEKKGSKKATIKGELKDTKGKDRRHKGEKA